MHDLVYVKFKDRRVLCQNRQEFLPERKPDRTRW